MMNVFIIGLELLTSVNNSESRFYSHFLCYI